ncbi:MAG TPA: hypothetical protein VFE38_12360 [Edaphobacter sp.]|nr:hypothetical protein [Edaphobacter sp.]
MNRAADTLALAESLLEQRCLSKALYFFDRAQHMGADLDRCSAGRWMAAMLSGDFEAGWRESDSIWRRNPCDSNRFWQGEDLLDKHIIIRCLHGFGDAVQFLRYVPVLKTFAKHIVVECAPEMVELARCFAGVETVITWNSNATALAAPVWDVQLEITELPYVLRCSLASLPFSTNYLKLPPYALRYAQQALGPYTQPRIGVTWAAGEWNPMRSLPFDTLRPILNHTEYQFWNLQGGPVRDHWQSLVPQANCRDHPALDNAGLIPLAAIISQLDLVITVDTLAAHLAGALNVPCFLMLQYAADWRWMIDRDDSPWYPSLRLFRQPRRGDWSGVIDQVDSVLANYISQDSKARSVA